MAVVKDSMQRPDDPELNELFEKIEAERKQKEERQAEYDRKRKERSDKIKTTHEKHNQLVEIGRKWLLNNTPVRGNIDCGVCSVVVTEICAAYVSEQPDVIGWSRTQTVLLEAKTSRADFLKDSKKWFRNKPEYGLGNFRLYIAPKGLIKPEELPEKWGLIEVDEKGKTRKIVNAERQKADESREKVILLSLLHRIGQNTPEGVSIRCYHYETKNRTTLTVTD